MTQRRIILTFVLLLFPLFIHAENDTIIIHNNDSSLAYIEDNLDSLLNNWFVRMSVDKYEDSVADSSIVDFPDSVYVDRIGKINSLITLPYNSIMRDHIQIYTGKKRNKFRIILGLKDYYFPMIEDIFDSYGLPDELKYVAVIESALNPNAVSRAGATGMWQFMHSTGKLYGLTINSVIDERRDPVKSTYAAAKYLKDMYAIYNDWILVVAAYNCGPGNVNKAIKRSGNKKDYWDIYYRLPRETRGYIPQFVAAAYAMNYYKEHGISPIHVDMPKLMDTVVVNKNIHLQQIATVLNLPIEELRAINPQYKTGLVPGKTRPMAITLPITKIGEFIDKSDSITGFKQNYYLTTVNDKVQPAVASPHSNTKPVDVDGLARVNYIVRDGDNLGFISSWFNVGLSNLRYWNNIYRNTIKVGQVLEIYVDPSKAGYYSKINSMSFDEKQQLIGKTATIAQATPDNSASTVKTNASATLSPKTASASVASSDADGEYELYIIRYGDTVWDIAKKEGVTASEILRLNGITSPSKMKIGQVIKIRKKS